MGGVPAELRQWCLDNGWDPGSGRPLSGGGVNTVVRLCNYAGETVVAKYAVGPPEALFAAEADGLRILTATGLVPVPDVLAVDAHYLILTDLGSSDLDQLDWAGLGRRIGALHGVSALAAGQCAGTLPEFETEFGDTSGRELRVPIRTQPFAHAQVLLDGQPHVRRAVLGEKTDAGQLRRRRRWTIAEYRDRAGRGFEQPDREVQQRRFARAVRTDQTDDRPAGIDTVQLVSARRRP